MKDYQQILFPYAYNVLGSAEDARDIIQDVIIKFSEIDGKLIENQDGYLVKSVINQSINLKKRNQRLYADSMWLPEPVSTERPDTDLRKNEIASFSMLVLLEKLTAMERAVFILKEGFDYAHQEIAAIIESSIENSRKLLSRAKDKLKKDVFVPASAQTDYDFLEGYVQAIKSGDVQAIENLLTEEIALSADGGGKIKVVSEFTTGKKATTDLLLYVFKTYQKHQTVRISEINHQPALLFFNGDKLVTCQVFEVEDNAIQNIYAVLAPNKLLSINP